MHWRGREYAKKTRARRVLAPSWKRWGVGRAETLYVGDSDVDIATVLARNAGLDMCQRKPVAFARGKRWKPRAPRAFSLADRRRRWAEYIFGVNPRIGMRRDHFKPKFRGKRHAGP